MKTLKELKARVQPGVRMLCIENTKRPELNGTVRIVNHVQGNAFTWNFEPGSGPVGLDLAADHPMMAKRSWTHWPPARGIEYLDGDTFKMLIADAYGPTLAQYVTLRIL